MPHTMTTLAFWASWVQIIGMASVVIAVIALLIAKDQLKEAKDAAEAAAQADKGQFILGVDDAFRNYEKVRRWINRKPDKRGPADKPKLSEVYRYIAVFERLGLFIQWGLLAPEEVDALYGDRFKRLVAFGDDNSFKQHFPTSVYSKFPPRENPTSWVGFIRLWGTIKEFREVGAPPPIQESENSKEDVDPED